MKKTNILISLLVLSFFKVQAQPNCNWPSMEQIDSLDLPIIMEVMNSKKELVEEYRKAIAEKRAEFEKLNKANPGTITFSNLEERQSCLSGNCKTGKGVLWEGNGEVYIGEFRNSKKHGFGKYLFNDCSIYMGEFENGLSHGYGTRIYHSKHYYIGGWQVDQRHGHGKMVHYGEVKEGEWLNGIVQKSPSSIRYSNVSNSESIIRYMMPLFIEGETLNLKSIFSKLQPNSKDFSHLFPPAYSDKYYTNYSTKVTPTRITNVDEYDLINFEILTTTTNDLVKHRRNNLLQIKNPSQEVVTVTFHKKGIVGGDLTLYFINFESDKRIVVIDFNSL